MQSLSENGRVFSFEICFGNASNSGVLFAHKSNNNYRESFSSSPLAYSLSETILDLNEFLFNTQPV